MQRHAVQRHGWKVAIGIALMLAAIFAYVASLDDSDPDALPAAVEPAAPQ